MRFSVVVTLTTFLVSLAGAVSSTDEYQDADTAQSGYMANHNIDPTTLSTYVHAWTYTCNTNEFFNAKPLTYTPKGYSHELVIIASQQNIVRVLDGFSGQLLYSRTLDPPFQASDSSCGDISPAIGITGTPIIDPSTDIMYFFSKGYKNAANGPVNTLAGQYKFYAVQLPALTNIPGYPIIIDGHYATNDNTRYFVGGTLLQRPGLALIGNSIVAGFGGHCDNFNYTGMLVSVHKSAAIVNNIQAMVAAPGGLAAQDNYLKPTGGKAGIWQGGMGLAVDGNNVYFATGNGVGAGINKGTTPYSGKVYSSTLEQVVAKFAVDPSSGTLTQADWFEPYNFDTQLDGNDRDMASAGVALLDRNTFKAPGVGVNGIAVASGKDGIVYVMNADNLGGFYNGAGTPPDATLQQITVSGGSFYGGVGSSPIDGGYLYFCPTGGPLYAYSYGLDGNGNPHFTPAGQIQTSPTTLACNGNPVVTSLNGQPGSGVVWLSDVNVGMVAFHAVPVNGVLVQISLGWSSGRLSKYQRPSFGNRRVYTTEQNMLYAIAPPSGTTTTASKSPISTKTSTSSKVSTSSKASTPTKASTSTKGSFSSSTRLVSSTTSSRSSATSSKSKLSTSSSLPSSSSGSEMLVTSVRSSTSTPIACSPIKTTATSSAKATATSNPKAILRTYNWNVGWVNAAPDGYTRAFVGINGQWPCPAITANIGDTIKINVLNNLGNETTSVHFHGLHQGNTTFEDGASMVSQCPIGPGESFVYEFILTQSGTYWYHSHVGGQYLDGFRGPIIIRDNTALANYGRIDGEYTLSLTDVYHVEAPFLINYYLSANNYNGAEPVPDSALINEGQNAKFNITPGMTYMFHIVNMGALAGQFLQFDEHNMTIIEADGVYTQPYEVSQLFVAVAQRYTVLITAKPSNCQNFVIVSQFLTDMFDSSVTPAGQQATCTAYLVYNAAAPLPAPFALTVKPWADTMLVPWDQQPLVYLTADFEQNDWGSNRAAINGLTYIPQKVPTFFTALTAPAAYQMNPQIYGQVNPQVVQYGQVVEIDLNNHDTRAHPFHLHGHQFQIIARAGDEPQWPGLYSTPPAPMRRDTVVVYPGVGVTIRFIANNPGVWLFHCHTEFHVEAGMTATFIAGPDVMVVGKPYIPDSHKTACDAQNIPRKGNAGGNSNNWLDLSNANTEPSQTYFGALINPPAVNPYTGGAD